MPCCCAPCVVAAAPATKPSGGRVSTCGMPFPSRAMAATLPACANTAPMRFCSNVRNVASANAATARVSATASHMQRGYSTSAPLRICAARAHARSHSHTWSMRTSSMRARSASMPLICSALAAPALSSPRTTRTWTLSPGSSPPRKPGRATSPGALSLRRTPRSNPSAPSGVRDLTTPLATTVSNPRLAAPHTPRRARQHHARTIPHGFPNDVMSLRRCSTQHIPRRRPQ